MGVRSLTSLVDSSLLVGPQDHLACSETSLNFFVWRKEDGQLQEHCSIELKSIANKVNDFFKNVLPHTLSDNQRTHLLNNVKIINLLYEKRNDEISQSYFLSFLNFVLAVVTCGFYSLKYGIIDETELFKERLELREPVLASDSLESTKNYLTRMEKAKRNIPNERVLSVVLSHFLNLSLEEKTQVLISAKNLGTWHIKGGHPHYQEIYLASFHHLVTHCRSLPLATLKRAFFDRLFNTHYTPQLENAHELIAELAISLAFKDSQEFLGRGIPPLFIELLNTLLTQIEKWSESQTLLLLIGIIHISIPISSPSESHITLIETLFENGFAINWQLIPKECRLPFLAQVEQMHKNHKKTWASVENGVYHSCYDSFQQLTDDERKHFFKLFFKYQIPLTRLTRPMIFGLLKCLATEKNLAENTNMVLQHVRGHYQDFDEQEVLATLTLMNTFDFFPLQFETLPGHLTYPQWHSLLNYLAKNPEEASKYTLVAIQLCFCAAQNSLKLDFLSILQHVGLLPDKYFAALTKGKNKLSKLFLKDPDRYLTKASEAQLTLYYSPLEKNLKVDFSHIVKRVGKAQGVPPLPQGAYADLGELCILFESINFTDPNQPGYIDPNNIIDDGIRYSLAELFDAIKTLVTNIQNETVPFAPKDPRERALFYQNLTLYLKHSILVLRGRRPQEYTHHLINLGIAGKVCGGKYFEVAQDLYYQVTGAHYVVDGETLEGGVLKLLAARRSSIVKGEMAKICGVVVGVHSLALGMKTVGLRFGASEAEAYQYDDPGTDGPGQRFTTLYEQNELHRACLAAYSPTVIINELTKHIEGLAGDPRTIKLEFRETINEWFKNKSDKPDVLSEEVYHPETYRIKRKRLICMAQQIGILAKPSIWNFYNLF